MTRIQSQHMTAPRNFSTDREIVDEIVEELYGVGDVRYGSAVYDPIRHQITAKLEDGRKLRLTVMFE